MHAISTSDASAGGGERLALLRDLDLFSELSEQEIEEISWTLLPFSCDAGVELFRQGDPADDMLCIRQGCVRLEMRLPGGASAELPEIGANEVLGELALMHGEPRSATAIAVEPVSGYRLPRHAFDAQRAAYRPAAFKLTRRLAAIAGARLAAMASELGDMGDTHAARIIRQLSPALEPLPPESDCELAVRELRQPATGLAPAMLLALPVFAEFTSDELEQLLAEIYVLEVSRGQLIFREGEAPIACYITVSGAVEVYLDHGTGRHKLGLYGPGNMFGQVALFDNSARTASCVAREESLLLGIDREQFDEMWGGGSILAFKLFDAVNALLFDAVRQSNRRLAWFRLNAPRQ